MSCDAVMKCSGSEVLLCMCGGGISLLGFFFFWLLVFVLKFVGGFFSMMTCLSFEGLLVLFVGSLAG